MKSSQIQRVKYCIVSLTSEIQNMNKLKSKIEMVDLMWLYTLMILAPGRLRQDDLFELMASLGYLLSSRLV